MNTLVKQDHPPHSFEYDFPTVHEGMVAGRTLKLQAKKEKFLKSRKLTTMGYSQMRKVRGKTPC